MSHNLSTDLSKSILKNVKTFTKLGGLFLALGANKPWPGYEIGLNEEEYDDFNSLIKTVKIHNGWFTEDNVRTALSSLGKMLDPKKLEEWISPYSNKIGKTQSKVALIMAGNLPLVGFHDFLSVIFSGHKALLKLSSSDTHLFRRVLDVLLTFDPDLKENIHVVEGKLEGFDKVIATGSNNTSRYFDHYFSHVPNIIRKSRHSIAILTGQESKEDLIKLGTDIFSYFGLGCRNVSKVYLPKDYDLDTFYKGIFEFSEVVNHNKYANNYDYNKAIWLLNDDNIFDNGFLLLKESIDFAAPTGSLYFERYEDTSSIYETIESRKEEIQCVVSLKDIPFGMTQNPSLSDYADNINTLDFLTE